MSSQRISLDHFDVPQLHTGWLRRFAQGIKRWREQLAQRETLAQLDARMLEDIGITPGDVWRETHGARSFF